MQRSPTHRTFSALTLLCFIVASKSFHTQVIQDRIIRDGVFRSFGGVDWFRCIKSCAEEENCASYNYALGEPNKTVCQLSSCGVREVQGCDENVLFFSRGFVFQQLKLIKGGSKCITDLPTQEPTTQAHKDCYDVYKSGKRVSGIYHIDPDGRGSVTVLCDHDTAGGGWTVFQRRLPDGTLEFFNKWSDYQFGFGDYGKEFWLGLDRLHRLTANRNIRLRVELTADNGAHAYSEYTGFRVADNLDKYRLQVISLAGGTAGDSLMTYHNGKPFSTQDGDNDNCTICACAERFHGAWWFDGTNDVCMTSDLNGGSIEWKSWNNVVTGCQMKLRPE